MGVSIIWCMLLGMITASTGAELVTELGDSSVNQPLVNTLELGEGMLQLVPSVLKESAATGSSTAMSITAPVAVPEVRAWVYHRIIADICSRICRRLISMQTLLRCAK